MLRQPGRTLRVLLGHASYMLQGLHDFRLLLDNHDSAHIRAAFLADEGVYCYARLRRLWQEAVPFVLCFAQSLGFAMSPSANRLTHADFTAA